MDTNQADHKHDLMDITVASTTFSTLKMTSAGSSETYYLSAKLHSITSRCQNLESRVPLSWLLDVLKVICLYTFRLITH